MMRSLCLSTVILCFAATSALNAEHTRAKRQHYATVPLYAACADYQVCSPPSVCYSGRCQCVQPYTSLGASCVTSNLYAQPLQHVPAYQQQYQQPPPQQYAPAIQHQPAPAVPTYQRVYTDVVSPVLPVQRVVPIAQTRVIAPQPVVFYPPQVQRIHIHDTTYVREQVRPPVPPAVVPPPVLPPTVVPPTPGPEIIYSTESPITTTDFGRQFDTPSIAYPGDFCQLPQTVCVGGSICSSNFCICRRGEDIVNQQCVRIEVPAETEYPPTASTSTTTTTRIPSTTTTRVPTTTAPTTTTTQTTTVTTTAPTTTTTTPSTTTTTTPRTTVTTPSTTTTTTTTTQQPTTTTTYFLRTSALPIFETTANVQTQTPTTQAPTTTTATTQSVPITTQPLITVSFANPEVTTQPCQATSCCPSGMVFNGRVCIHGKILRINLVVSGPGQQCMNSAQCTRGAYCNQGTCNCATRYAPQGSTCVLRK